MVVVAQLVERRTVAPQVAGPNPVDHPKTNIVSRAESLLTETALL
jgi:hypothetical protein